jgi:hypothetical protein
MEKQYLGDGLYFEDDGYQVRLFCDRYSYTHEVYLDGPTLQQFFRVLGQSRELQFKITPLLSEDSSEVPSDG